MGKAAKNETGLLSSPPPPQPPAPSPQPPVPGARNAALPAVKAVKFSDGNYTRTKGGVCWFDRFAVLQKLFETIKNKH